MSFMNDILSSATLGESDRLDVALRDLGALQARFDALVALLNAKGIVTVDELAELNRETQPSVTNDELDRLDTNVR